MQEYNIPIKRENCMKKMNPPTLAIVIPCYNEEEVLPETIKQLSHLYQILRESQQISNKSFITFVDDGSYDITWSLIQKYAKASSFVKGIKLSKNEGHQHALLAGMQYVFKQCDCMVSLDADLQQDPFAISDMLKAYQEGNQVVLGIRENRDPDSFFKRFSAESYYKLMNFMGVSLEFNHADYRLLSHKALGFFLQFKERNLFIRGIVKLVGLQSTNVYFKSSERFAGESKYPLKKMLAFAWSGITSFSLVPLQLITISGVIIFIASLVAGVDALYTVFFTNDAVPGWASTVLPMYFVGGIELLAIGILGEYIGKIYTESKARPLYFIEEEV